MKYLKEIFEQISNIFWMVFENDLDVLSRLGRKILSNPDDLKKYRNAIKRIENGESEVEIELSNGEKITLI